MKDLITFFAIALIAISAQAQNPLAPVSQIEFNSIALNTNFIVPMVKYNFDHDKPVHAGSSGNLGFFNGVGAGLGLSWGRVTIREKNGNTLSENTLSQNKETEMRNAFGINAGVIFSSSGDTSGTKTFAPVVSINVLDFAAGVGYDLGTVQEDISRIFVTVSYNLPLQKLTNVGSLLLRPVTYPSSTNPKSSLYLF